MDDLSKSLSLGNGGLMTGGGVFSGGLSEETFSRLQKALVASPSTPGGAGDGASLIPQSLARTLKNVSFKMRNIKAWRNTIKQEAYAMEEEYDQLLTYGTRGGIFTSPMATPAGNDSTFTRQQVAMRYMATAYATDIAIMSTEIIGGSAEALQINNATRFLLGGVERQMFYGDSTILPSAFDGWKSIIQKFAANNTEFDNIVINAHANPISVELVENAAQVIQDNGGDISAGTYRLYMAPHVQSYFSKTYAPAQRYNIDQRALLGEGELKIGTPAGGYNSTYGYIPFENDIFLNLDQPIAASLQNAPSIPAGLNAILNTSDAASKWQTPGNANNYGVGYNGGPVQYAIAAANSFGPSPITSLTTTVTVGVGESVTLTWNRVTGTNGANYYEIYRSVNGGPMLPITKVADAGTGAVQSFTDENTTVAGTYDVFLINHDAEEGAVFKQLLPFFKWPLPIPVLARYFAVALIGAPIIYVPSRCVLITNVQIPGTMVPAPILS